MTPPLPSRRALVVARHMLDRSPVPLPELLDLDAELAAPPLAPVRAVA